MNKIRIWWIPQVPMKAFRYEVSSIDEAISILEVLGLYDIFQYENNVKGDFSNAGGIEIWHKEEQEWWDFDPEFDMVE